MISEENNMLLLATYHLHLCFLLCSPETRSCLGTELRKQTVRSRKMRHMWREGFMWGMGEGGEQFMQHQMGLYLSGEP